MKKFYLGPKFGTLINREWITNIWVVTAAPGNFKIAIPIRYILLAKDHLP
jgi:hypothetical protein